MEKRPYSRERIPRICPNCGTAFTITHGTERKGAGTYCCRACQVAHSSNNEADFWSHLDTTGNCSLWTGFVHPKGYGIAYLRGKQWRAHRLAWTLKHGPIPAGLDVCHHCDANYPPGDITYRRCCRDDHLWLGTQTENIHDMEAKGRAYHPSGDANGSRKHPERLKRGDESPARLHPGIHQGTRNGRAVLVEDDVRTIRRLAPANWEDFTAIARVYRVTPQSVRNAALGITWRHIE